MKRDSFGNLKTKLYGGGSHKDGRHHKTVGLRFESNSEGIKSHGKLLQAMFLAHRALIEGKDVDYTIFKRLENEAYVTVTGVVTRVKSKE